MPELGYHLGPSLVRQRVRIDMEVISQQSVEVADEISFRAAVGQLYSFFISASLTSDSALRTGTTEKK